MDDRTREALKESISKWDALTKVQKSIEAHIGPKDCPLCVLFKYNIKGHCHGCPVKEFTGKLACEGSPYDFAQAAKLNWLHNIDPDQTTHYRAAFQDAAIKERDFMKSLLPVKAVAS